MIRRCRIVRRSGWALLIALLVGCSSDDVADAPTATVTALPPTATAAPSPTTEATPTVAAVTTVQPAGVETAPAAEIVAPEGGLVVTGAVASTLTLTRDDLEAYPQVDVPAEVTGGTTGFRGPRLADLLTEAGASTSATTVIFTTADGTTTERPLEELLGRFDVLVALGDDARLQVVDPRLDSPVAVDGVVRVEVR